MTHEHYRSRVHGILNSRGGGPWVPMGVEKNLHCPSASKRPTLSRLSTLGLLLRSRDVGKLPTVSAKAGNKGSRSWTIFLRQLVWVSDRSSGSSSIITWQCYTALTSISLPQFWGFDLWYFLLSSRESHLLLLCLFRLAHAFRHTMFHWVSDTIDDKMNHYFM